MRRSVAVNMCINCSFFTLILFVNGAFVVLNPGHAAGTHVVLFVDLTTYKSVYLRSAILSCSVHVD